jgi:hypothetical protein
MQMRPGRWRACFWCAVWSYVVAQPGSQRSVLAHLERKAKPYTGLTPPATEAAILIQQSCIAVEARQWKREPLQNVTTSWQATPGRRHQYTGPRADSYILIVEAVLYWLAMTSLMSAQEVENRGVLSRQRATHQLAFPVQAGTPKR